MTEILVTGGAGYIGSHCCAALHQAGFAPVIVDNLQSAHPGVPSRLNELCGTSLPFYEIDIRDENALMGVFARHRIAAVMHFAANSLVGESMQNPLKYYDNNVGGSRTLLAAMLRHKVENIVFSSTAAVYGEPKALPITEDAPTSPTNTYGETKLAIERMMHWAGIAHGLRYTALRYFNACGAHESGRIGEAHNPETHLIPNILKADISGTDFTLYGTDYETPDGTCIRDYIHVLDLADAHILAMNYLLKGGASAAFNLGSGAGFSNREIISAAETAIGRSIPIAAAPRRPGDPARLIASSQKARDVLGWNPTRTDMGDIVASAWRWHSQNPDGYGGREEGC